jgi:hypothetical protein
VAYQKRRPQVTILILIDGDIPFDGADKVLISVRYPVATWYPSGPKLFSCSSLNIWYRFLSLLGEHSDSGSSVDYAEGMPAEDYLEVYSVWARTYVGYI